MAVADTDGANSLAAVTWCCCKAGSTQYAVYCVCNLSAGYYAYNIQNIPNGYRSGNATTYRHKLFSN